MSLDVETDVDVEVKGVELPVQEPGVKVTKVKISKKFEKAAPEFLYRLQRLSEQ